MHIMKLGRKHCVSGRSTFAYVSYRDNVMTGDEMTEGAKSEPSKIFVAKCDVNVDYLFQSGGRALHFLLEKKKIWVVCSHIRDKRRFEVRIRFGTL